MKKVNIIAMAAIMALISCNKISQQEPQAPAVSAETRTIKINLVPSEELTKTVLLYEDNNIAKATTLKWAEGDKVVYWQATADNATAGEWGTGTEAEIVNGAFTATVIGGMEKMKVVYAPLLYKDGDTYAKTPDNPEQTQSVAGVFNPKNLILKADIILSEYEAGTQEITVNYNTVGSLVRWGLTGEGQEVKSFSMNNYNDSFATVRTTTVTLDTPVTLSSEPQFVYIVCEAHGTTYMEPGSFTLTDGKTYYYCGAKQSLRSAANDNQLVVNKMNRASVNFTSDKFKTAVDLSASETSNCYIVSAPGAYSFNAGKQGCSSDAIQGTPAGAKLIWCFNEANSAQSTSKIPTVCKNISYKDGRISFVAVASEEGTLMKGNWLIAVTDASDAVLWSWHIWATEQPSDIPVHTPAGGGTDWILMDRNLGATWCDYAADTRDVSKMAYARGLLYQWGRKDPFLLDKWTLTNGTASIETAIANPNVVYSNTAASPWMNPVDNTLWQDDVKTKYDPCPAGYKVPKKDVFRFMAPYSTTSADKCMIKSIDTSFKEAIFYTYTDSYTDKTNWSGEIRFALGGNIKHGITTVGRDGTGSRGDYWTSSADASTGRAFRVYFADGKFNNGSAHTDYGFAVRCVRE